jgi:hypothetical protein
MEEPKSKDWLLLNAVECWLYHFPEHPMTQQYQGLRDELKQPAEVRKRGRPAKRQRKAKASEDTAS